MSFDTERIELGRKPVLQCEMYLDRCANTYGDTITNLISDPEDFSAVSWTPVNTPVITTNVATAPNGTLTADQVEDNSATFFEYILDEITFNASANYHLSLYAKKDDTPRATRFCVMRILFQGSTTENFDLQLDTKTGEFAFQGNASGTGGVIDAGDYWRIWIKANNTDGANTNASFVFFPAAGASDDWIDSATATGSVIIWGAQAVIEDFLPFYGAGTCAAPGASGSECYNTRVTCQDPDNYTRGVPFYLRFSDTLVDGEAAIPCLKSASLAPTVINPDKGLGVRASIKLTMGDFTHNDIGLDPYVDNRSYDALSQGTYFGKLMARHRHFIGRPLCLKSGYVSSSGYDRNDFQTRNYVIEAIEGPDRNGRINVTAKDILKLADDERAQAPAPSTGSLTAGITAGATTLTVTSGTETDYDESEYIRIADEIILAPDANRTANVFANLSRGQFNTEASAHDSGDGVQACKHLNATNVVDLVEDLLVNYANIPSSYINSTDWASAKTNWYGTSTITTLITEPEGVASLINELAEQFFFQIWWNEIDQEIRFEPIVPPVATSLPQLNDDDNLVAGSVSVKRDQRKRVSRVVIYYDPYTPIETDDAEDYKGIYVTIQADRESADEYNDVRQRLIHARFVDTEAIAVQTASRLLARWQNAPAEIEYQVDAKDAGQWTGDVVDIESRSAQTVTGANGSMRTQVLSVQELTSKISGSHYKYKALELNFSGRYGFIGPNTLNDYNSESAANKADYGFIGPDTGLFDDDEAPYQII